MGTIQKIVDSLIKTSNDKKENLSGRYRDHSQWLGNELELIRKLINQNPRDKFSFSGSKNITNSNNLRTSSSSKINNEVEIISKNTNTDTSRQKRKSSESKTKDQVRDDLCSPEAKRSSIDIQLIFEKALDKSGLPRDLNKLKKENLLAEIEARGVTNFSMKSLKKELVDNLKDLLISEVSKINDEEDNEEVDNEEVDNECNEVNMSGDNNTNNDDENHIKEEIKEEEVLLENEDNTKSNNIISQSTGTNVEESIPSVDDDVNKSPLRKGSMMTEFRNLVKNNNQIAADALKKERDSDASRNERIHNEFESRQKRHNERKSQANQQINSPVKELTSPDKSDSNSHTQSINPTWMEVSSPVPNSPTPVVNNNKDSNELQKEEEDIEDVKITVNDISLEKEENTSSHVEIESNDDNIVQSDNNENELNDKDDNIEDKEEDQETKIEVEKVEVINEEIKAEEVEIVIEKHTVSKKEVSQVVITVPVVSNVPRSSPSSPKNSTKSNIPGIIKKPSNLMSGQSSFLEKAPVKPIVPALEKANKLRAAEEAKLLQKKKDMEKRKAAASNSIQPVSTTNGTKSQSTWERMTYGKPASKIYAPGSSKNVASISSTSSTSSTPSQSHASVPITPAVSITTPNAPDSTTENVPQKKGLLAFLNKKTVTQPASSGMGFDINACELKPQVAPVAPVVDVVVPVIEEAVKKIEPVVATVIVPVKVEAPVIAKVSKIEPETNNTVIDGSKIHMKIHSPGPFPPHGHSPLVLKVPNPNNNATISNKASSPIVTKAKTSSVVTPASVKVAPIQHQSAQNLAQTQSALRDITQEVIEQEDDQYIIDDGESSGSSSGSGTDDEAENEKQKRIPEWARAVNLKEALERQYGLNGHTSVDPDTIFHEVQTCSLEEIFGLKEGRNYSKRTSSAKWDADEITLVEKRTYRSQMGFAGVDKSPVSKTYR
jgi:hypothetical protein